jgi:hypothetical protein
MCVFCMVYREYWNTLVFLDFCTVLLEVAGEEELAGQHLVARRASNLFGVPELEVLGYLRSLRANVQFAVRVGVSVVRVARCRWLRLQLLVHFGRELGELRDAAHRELSRATHGAP